MNSGVFPMNKYLMTLILTMVLIFSTGMLLTAQSREVQALYDAAVEAYEAASAPLMPNSQYSNAKSTAPIISAAINKKKKRFI